MNLIILVSFGLALLSRLSKHPNFKIALTSGFGVLINLCMKSYVQMTYNTLDDVYPSIGQVFFILLVLILASLMQSSLTSALMQKIEGYQVYSGYYLVNVLLCTLITQVIYEEPLSWLSYFSLILVVLASLVLSSERYSDKNLLFQELE
jgi:multidrug transporter EmrE-like cation transporter